MLKLRGKALGHNYRYNKSWLQHVAPALKSLSLRGCKVLSIRLNDDTTTILVENTRQVRDSFPTATYQERDGRGFMVAVLNFCRVVWEVKK